MKNLLTVLIISLISACSHYANQDEAPKSDVVMLEVKQNNLAPYNEYSIDAYGSKMYHVAASRTTNKMLKEVEQVYEDSPCKKVYVMQAKKHGQKHIPDGYYHTQNMTKNIIKDSKVLELVDSTQTADCKLDIQISKIEIPNQSEDFLQYKLVLLNKENIEINSWSEDIAQIKNDDRSWW